MKKWTKENFIFIPKSFFDYWIRNELEAKKYPFFVCMDYTYDVSLLLTNIAYICNKCVCDNKHTIIFIFKWYIEVNRSKLLTHYCIWWKWLSVLLSRHILPKLLKNGMIISLWKSSFVYIISNILLMNTTLRFIKTKCIDDINN